MRGIVLDDRRRDLLDGRRQGNSRRLEHTAARALDLVPQEKSLSVLLHLRGMQLTQVLNDVGPFEFVPTFLQAAL
jgi:hypothetical protein